MTDGRTRVRICACWRERDHASVIGRISRQRQASGDGFHHGCFGGPGLSRAERHEGADEDKRERDGHRRPHRVDECVGENRVPDLADLGGHVRRDARFSFGFLRRQFLGIRRVIPAQHVHRAPRLA